MKSLPSFLAIGLALYLSPTSWCAEPESAAGWTPTAMLQVKRIGVVQVSPDGKLAAYTVRRAIIENEKSEYLTHIWLADTEGKKSWQLTQGDKSCDEPQWSPDGKWVAFVSKRADKANLWLISPSGGEAQQLTKMPGDVSSFQWSTDGSQIAFTAIDAKTEDERDREREKNDARVVDENIKRQRLYVMAVKAPPELVSEPRQLTEGELNIAIDSARPGRAAFDWSPDGKTICFSHTKSPHADHWPSADLSLINVASKKVTPLLGTPAAEGSPRYSPDGQTIAFVGSDNPPTWAGRRRIYVLPANGGVPRPLADTADDFGRYSELIGWNENGKELLYSEIQGVDWKLLAMPLNGSPHLLSNGNGMSLSGAALNHTRTIVGYSFENSQQPAEAHVSALKEWKPLTVSRVNRDVPTAVMPKTEAIRWKNNDFEIEGLLTYPINYKRGNKYPLLVIAHGGPMGAFTRTCDASPGTYPVAAFASRGYCILRPNVRGSSGYGAKLRYANYNDWGGGDYRDLLAGVDHVIKLGVADGERMGIMGWSYGGFMTSWTVTQTNRFKAASVGAGVTNLVSFTGTADIPSFLPDYFGGQFWDKPQHYEKHSAMFHVRGVKTPTLIQHGEKDERVPLSQGQEFYNALKQQGCTTKMVIYPRTPHGIEEPALLLDCMQRNLDWFDQYVNGSP